jgi:DNA polymerase III epsilon subunit-like protein
MRIIGLDTETGGIPLDRSLLTLYAGVYDFHFYADSVPVINKLDGLYLKCKPNNRLPYIVDATALKVNKIDLVALYEEALDYTECGRKLYDFISRYSANGKERMTLVGQNVGFDLDHIISIPIISKNSWENHVSRKKLDTMEIAEFAKVIGLLPPDMSTSLANLVKYFNIPYDAEKAHSADYDVEMTIAVFVELTRLFGGFPLSFSL